MDHSIGAVLFSVAVISNFVLILVGVIAALGVSIYRGRSAAAERNETARKHDAAFHHPDPVNTSLFEKVFMAGATALVLVGLPVVLAATFHYLLPMLGHVASP